MGTVLYVPFVESIFPTKGICESSPGLIGWPLGFSVWLVKSMHVLISLWALFILVAGLLFSSDSKHVSVAFSLSVLFFKCGFIVLQMTVPSAVLPEFTKLLTGWNFW